MKGSRYGNSYSGIGVVYKRECSRALYGVTFIDHNTGVVLNGSRLGKEYAANAIVDRLENSRQYEHLFNDPQFQGSTQFTSQKQQPLPSQNIQFSHHTEQHSENSSIGDPIGSLFDIPILPNGDYQEVEMFRRRMQKEKKRGRLM